MGLVELAHLFEDDPNALAAHVLAPPAAIIVPLRDHLLPMCVDLILKNQCRVSSVVGTVASRGLGGRVPLATVGEDTQSGMAPVHPSREYVENVGTLTQRW